MPQTQFQNWFKPLQLIRADDRAVVLGVPSRFHEEWLRNHYSQQLKQAIKKHSGGSELQLEFEILVQNVQEENIEASLGVTKPLPPPPGGRPNLRIVENPSGVSSGMPRSDASAGFVSDLSSSQSGRGEAAPAPESPNFPVFVHSYFEPRVQSRGFPMRGHVRRGRQSSDQSAHPAGGSGHGQNSSAQRESDAEHSKLTEICASAIPTRRTSPRKWCEGSSWAIFSLSSISTITRLT